MQGGEDDHTRECSGYEDGTCKLQSREAWIKLLRTHGQRRCKIAAALPGVGRQFESGGMPGIIRQPAPEARLERGVTVGTVQTCHPESGLRPDEPRNFPIH